MVHLLRRLYGVDAPVGDTGQRRQQAYNQLVTRHVRTVRI